MSLWKKWTKAAGLNTEVVFCELYGIKEKLMLCVHRQDNTHTHFFLVLFVMNKWNSNLEFQGVILQSKWDVFKMDKDRWP